MKRQPFRGNTPKATQRKENWVQMRLPTASEEEDFAARREEFRDDWYSVDGAEDREELSYTKSHLSNSTTSFEYLRDPSIVYWDDDNDEPYDWSEVDEVKKHVLGPRWISQSNKEWKKDALEVARREGRVEGAPKIKTSQEAHDSIKLTNGKTLGEMKKEVKK